MHLIFVLFITSTWTQRAPNIPQQPFETPLIISCIAGGAFQGHCSLEPPVTEEMIYLEKIKHLTIIQKEISDVAPPVADEIIPVHQALKNEDSQIIGRNTTIVFFTLLLLILFFAFINWILESTKQVSIPKKG
jgi:hypothetical protein